MDVLLADDQPEVRSALRLLLDQEPDLVVVGEASQAEELLAQVQTIGPDLVLLDWELPGGKTAELVRCLRALQPTLLVVATSGRPEAGCGALSARVDAFVSKGDPPERLLEALRSLERPVKQA